MELVKLFVPLFVFHMFIKRLKFSTLREICPICRDDMRTEIFPNNCINLYYNCGVSFSNVIVFINFVFRNL
jgi:hypothetical protein